jgi:hypothetical protein
VESFCEKALGAEQHSHVGRVRVEATQQHWRGVSNPNELLTHTRGTALTYRRQRDGHLHRHHPQLPRTFDGSPGHALPVDRVKHLQLELVRDPDWRDGTAF